MGVAQAGLAMKCHSTIDVKAIVEALSGDAAKEVGHPDRDAFDVRKPNEVMVQQFGDAYFFCNGSFAWDLLANPSSSFEHSYRSLGYPPSFMVYCRYDSGGSWGYALVEGGKLIRSRLQTTDLPDIPPVIEFGKPQEIEQRWLQAHFFFEDDEPPPEKPRKIYFQNDHEQLTAEDGLTARILDDFITSRLGVCPWDTQEIPVLHFYKTAKMQATQRDPS